VSPATETRGRHAVSLAEQANTLTSTSLAALIRDGVPPPQLLDGGLLYAEGVHVISGEPDCGKTTIALWLALSLMRRSQPVLFLDEESGPEMIAEKLIALGATEEDAEHLAYIPFPGRAWNIADITALRALLDDVQPVMVLLDSVSAFLARAGLDENKAADVTSFWSRLLLPLARTAHAAVVAIDHDTKAGDSRYSRGSGAKLAASDVMVKVDMTSPFTRAASGALRLTITKDRRGWLHRNHDARVQTGDGRIRILLAAASTGHDPAASSLKPAEEKLLAVLAATPATRTDLVDKVAAQFGHGLRRETAYNALAHLAELGLADRIDQGAGNAVLWLKPAAHATR